MTKSFRIPTLLSSSALLVALSIGGCSTANAFPGQSALGGALSSAAGAASQSAGSSLAGSLGSLGSGLSLPNLSNSSTANLAGVLKYCIANNLTSSVGSASSLLSTATHTAGVSNSAGYAAGQQGILQSVLSQSGTQQQQFSLSSLAAPLRQKACSMIQSRLQNLL